MEDDGLCDVVAGYPTDDFVDGVAADIRTLADGLEIGSTSETVDELRTALEDIADALEKIQIKLYFDGKGAADYLDKLLEATP